MAANSDIQAELSEAKVYEEMGLYAEALAAYEKVLSEQDTTDSKLTDEINDHIVRLRKIVADDSLEDDGNKELTREALGDIKNQATENKDIAPILDRASVFLEKGLYEEAADEYAMLFSIGYSFDSIIPPIIEFLKTFCPYGYMGRELSKVIDKFNLQPNELAEISAFFGAEIGKQGQYSAAIGLLEKAKGLDPENEKVEKMYDMIIDQFMSEPVTGYLLRRTKLTKEQLIEALNISFVKECSLFYSLVKSNHIDKDRLLKALSDYHKYPSIEFDPELNPPHRLVSKLQKDVLLCQGWVPLEMGPSTYKVVVDNPDDTYKTEQVKRMLAHDDIDFCIALQEDIELLTEHFFKVGADVEKTASDSRAVNEDENVVMDIVDMLERKSGWSREKKVPIRPQLISAEVVLKEAGDKQESLLVRLKDSTDSGFGILVSSEEYKRINKVKAGDMLNDMIFYAGWAMLRTKSLVKNVTRIGEGKDKGYYFVEIESEDVA